LGEGYYWNPETLPNSHIVAIGASGSGKTQTLKAILPPNPTQITAKTLNNNDNWY
jgi:ABC-type proline/glycine betaine transport system ATPase subunit